MVDDYPVIIGWYCPDCPDTVYEGHGWCHFCGAKLKPLIEEIDEL